MAGFPSQNALDQEHGNSFHSANNNFKLKFSTAITVQKYSKYRLYHRHLSPQQDGFYQAFQVKKFRYIALKT